MFLGVAILAASHILEVNHPLLHAEDGFLIGNGDLSCSIFQTADDLVFRLGKGDVWDRRIDYSKQPKPANVDEIIDGVLNCGWKVDGWNAENVKEMKGLKNGKRLLEIAKGRIALNSAGYPVPKPTGELRLRLPIDLGQPERLRQRLFIEEGYVTVDYWWRGGKFHASFEAVVAPDENVLAVSWRMDGWNAETMYDNKAPIHAKLIRRADRDYATWQSEYIAEYPLYPASKTDFSDFDCTPLPSPQVIAEDTIEQRFYPDAIYPGGFRYRMKLMPLYKFGSFYRPPLPKGEKDAYVVFAGGKANPPWGVSGGWEKVSGAVAVAVTTSSDKTLEAPAPRSFADYKAAAKAAGAAYWAKSSFSMPDDSELESLWYSTYHARRAVLKPGTVPPGLFYPSMLPDYSRWNGDYHSNYNVQSIYCGDFTANRLDQSETFFDMAEFSVPIGRKIAKEYYGCRGMFFPLQMFPCHAPEDYNGSLPLGRMVYMTGWIMERYWDYYLYTLDKEFLAKRGYPMIKDCALFYLDFLKKAPHPKLPPQLNDGRYHVFPSVQGESGFKDAMDMCDKPQAVKHVRHTLWCAVEASKALDVDAGLRREWQERLDNLVGCEELAKLTPYERHCRVCRPQGEGGEPWKPVSERSAVSPLTPNVRYPGFYHRVHFGKINSSAFIPDRDFPVLRGELLKWRRENGLVWAMGAATQQRPGGWTETLSCMASVQAMLLQSWDGAIRLFPSWVEDKDVSFHNWRAQGAFLVDAEWKDGRPGKVQITSEKGGDCRFWGDWEVFDSAGCAVPCGKDAFGRNVFRTTAGGRYELRAQ